MPIPAAAFALQHAADGTLFDKTALLVGADGARVVVEHDEGGAAQVQFSKGVAQQRAHRIRAIAFTPMLTFTQPDRDQGVTVVPVQFEETDKTNWLLTL